MQTRLNIVSAASTALAVGIYLILFVARPAEAQTQDGPPHGPEQKKIGIFAGEWNYEGTLSETPLGPGGKFHGKTVGKLTLDGFFVESRSEDKGVYGGKERVFKGMEVLWYDPMTKTYIHQSFDNEGVVSRSVATERDNTWTETGAMTMSNGKSYKTRSSAVFSPDGRMLKMKVELLTDDGKTWISFWELTSRKVASSRQ